jgi:hypothetical protein
VIELNKGAKRGIIEEREEKERIRGESGLSTRGEQS